MGNFFFSPDPVVVTAGDTITWLNSSGLGHTTTSGVRGEGTAGSLWDHTVSTEGSSPAVTFDTAGTFAYFCRFHFGMDGLVTVQAAPTPVPVPGATPWGLIAMASLLGAAAVFGLRRASVRSTK